MAGDNRPDFSKYLAHFTTNRRPVANDANNPTVALTDKMTAYDRLKSFGQYIIWDNLKYSLVLTNLINVFIRLN